MEGNKHTHTHTHTSISILRFIQRTNEMFSEAEGKDPDNFLGVYSKATAKSLKH